MSEQEKKSYITGASNGPSDVTGAVRGRPAKPRPVVNSADASPRRVLAYAAAIGGTTVLAYLFPDKREQAQLITELAQKFGAKPVQKLHAQMVDWFPQVNDRAAVAYELAHEVVASEAVAGLVEIVRANSKGPRPKLSQAAFASTVRALMAQRGVELKQWRSEVGRRTELNDLCALIYSACGKRWVPLSGHTEKYRLSEGFSGE